VEEVKFHRASVLRSLIEARGGQSDDDEVSESFDDQLTPAGSQTIAHCR